MKTFTKILLTAFLTFTLLNITNAQYCPGDLARGTWSASGATGCNSEIEKSSSGSAMNGATGGATSGATSSYRLNQYDDDGQFRLYCNNNGVSSGAATSLTYKSLYTCYEADGKRNQGITMTEYCVPYDDWHRNNSHANIGYKWRYYTFPGFNTEWQPSPSPYGGTGTNSVKCNPCNTDNGINYDLSRGQTWNGVSGQKQVEKRLSQVKRRASIDWNAVNFDFLWGLFEMPRMA